MQKLKAVFNALKTIRIVSPWPKYEPIPPNNQIEVNSAGLNHNDNTVADKQIQEAQDTKAKKFFKQFTSLNSVIPTRSSLITLTTYPRAQKDSDPLNQDKLLKNATAAATSLSTSSGKMSQFLVTDKRILDQFPDSKRGILVSENLYDEFDQWRFADCYKMDGQVKNVITTFVLYGLGRGRPKVVLDTNEDYESSSDEQASIEAIMQNQSYIQVRRSISKTLRKMGFHEILIEALINNAVHGRACIQKIYYDPGEQIPNRIVKGNKDPDNDKKDKDSKFGNKENTEAKRSDTEDKKDNEEDKKQFEKPDLEDPTIDYTKSEIPKKIIKDFVVLHPLRLGKVYYYRDTRKLAGVEYLDYDEGENIILAKDMLYFCGDIVQTNPLPRVYYQGYSMVEPMVDISEATILNNQTNIKEINRSLWANFMILKFLNKSPESIQEFIDNYESGRPIATNADVESTVVQPGSDLKAILEQRDMSDQKISRDGKTPEFITGFPNVQNFATAETFINAWVNSILRAFRTMIRNVIEPQLIDELVAEFTGAENREAVLDYEYKVKMEFENIPIKDPLSVMAPVLIQLKNAGFIDEEVGLELLDLKYVIPKLQKIKEEKEAKEQEMFNAIQTGKPFTNPQGEVKDPKEKSRFPDKNKETESKNKPKPK